MNRGDWWTADAATRQIMSRELLQDVRVLLGTSPSAIEICTQALLSVATALSFTGTALWFIGEDGKLRCRGFASTAAMTMFEAQSRELAFGPGEGMPGRTFLHATVEWIPNVVRDDNFPRLRGAIHDLVRTVVGFPALEGGSPVAIIEMFSREVRERDIDTVALFAALGELVGGYIARVTHRVNGR